MGDIKLNYDNKIEPRYVPKNYEVKSLPINLNFALTETYRWLGRPTEAKPPPVRKPKKSSDIQNIFFLLSLQ